MFCLTNSLFQLNRRAHFLQFIHCFGWMSVLWWHTTTARELKFEQFPLFLLFFLWFWSFFSILEQPLPFLVRSDSCRRTPPYSIDLCKNYFCTHLCICTFLLHFCTFTDCHPTTRWANDLQFLNGIDSSVFLLHTFYSKTTDIQRTADIFPGIAKVGTLYASL